MVGSGVGEKDAILRMNGLNKHYSTGVAALADLDLSVSAGEFVGVVGPSGCGKTTLLRLIAGLERPSTGSVRRGTDDLAYVFQEPTLLPWQTVRRNVELVAALRGVPRAQRRSRALHALDQVGLTAFAGHRPHQLSGGMRMRAALAQALTGQPELFLLDEPFAAVDELTRNRLCEDFHALYLARRFTAVLVTHSIAEAIYLCGRILVLSGAPGRVLADLPVPLEMPRRPTVRYAPEFAGIAGTIAAHLGAP